MMDSGLQYFMNETIELTLINEQQVEEGQNLTWWKNKNKVKFISILRQTTQRNSASMQYLLEYIN